MRVGLLSFLFLLGVAVGGGGVFVYSLQGQIAQGQAIANQLGYANGVISLARDICPNVAEASVMKISNTKK